MEPVGLHQGSNALLIIRLRYHSHLTLQPVLIFIRKLPLGETRINEILADVIHPMLVSSDQARFVLLPATLVCLGTQTSRIRDPNSILVFFHFLSYLTCPSLSAYQLKGTLPKGKVITECGVSTSEGTKVPDVVWLSSQHPQVLKTRVLAAKPAPEICIEILSSDNTAKEIREKTALYFEAGAREVWICDLEGKMRFLSTDW